MTREKAILETENVVIYNELQKANEQKAELEIKLLQANSLLKELQQLQGLQHEEEGTLREVEEMHKINGNTIFRSAGEAALIEFNYSEVQREKEDTLREVEEMLPAKKKRCTN